MTKDFIKWLAIEGLKKSIEEWSKLKERYIGYLSKETNDVVKNTWIYLIKQVDDSIDYNNKLLKEVKDYEF